MFYGWYIVGASCLISLYVSGTVFLGFTAAFEPIANEFGWSYTEISFATSLRGLEVSLFVPVAGMIMDRWGPKKLVGVGIALSGFGLILLSRITSLGMFYAAFILVSTGVAATSSTLMTVTVGNWFRKKMGLAMGMAASGVAFGGLLMPLITHLTDTSGWRQASFIMGLGMWVFPLPLSLLLRHKPEQYGYLPYGAEIQSVPNGDHVVSEKKKEVTVSTREVLTSRTFWIIATGFLFQMLPVSAVMTHIMPYLSTIGIARARSSFIVGALPLLTVIGRVGLGWFGDLVEKRVVASLAFALTSLGVLILGFTTTGRTWVIFSFIVVFGIGWGGAVPSLPGLLRAYFGGEKLGTVVGCAGSVMMIGMMAGAPFAGWVFDQWGIYRPAWFVLAGASSIVTICFYAFLKKTPR